MLLIVKWIDLALTHNLELRRVEALKIYYVSELRDGD